MTRRTIIGLSALLVLLGAFLFLVVRTPDEQASDEIKFRLKWVFYSSFGNHFVADKSGYYKDEGIDVHIRAGGASLDPLKLVASGEDDVGLASYGQILMACEKGLPLVAIGQSNISSGVVFMALKRSGITRPDQFLGKKVGVIPGSDTGSVYAAVMSKLKLDRSKIDEVTIGFSVDPLLNGSIDVSTVAFSTNQPLFIQNQGIAVNVIDPKDYGVEVGGNVYFVRRDFLERNKELLKRFLRADLRGTGRAFEMSDEEVVKIALSYNNLLDRDAELAIWRATKATLLPKTMTNIGVMPLAMWKQTNDVFSASGLTSGNLNYGRCYTNELVQGLFD